MSKRAVRRHHYQRLKKKREWYWGGPVGTEVGVRYTQTEEERLGALASTPHPCSCIGCANLRRIEGPPMQERRAEVDAQEQIQEAGGELSQDT